MLVEVCHRSYKRCADQKQQFQGKEVILVFDKQPAQQDRFGLQTHNPIVISYMSYVVPFRKYDSNRVEYTTLQML